MNVRIRPEDLDALEAKTKEIQEGMDRIRKEWDRIMTPLLPPASAPSAFLFFAGNAIYFDEQGEQIVELQKEGWCGLHEFVARYPEASVEFHPWRQPPPYVVGAEYLPGVLACLRGRKAKVKR